MSLLFLLYITSFHLLFSVQGASLSSKGQRIVGGQDADPTEFNFAAAIYVQTASGRFFCGGSLVYSTWVLTSGHCVNNATSFTIQLGSSSLTTPDSNRVIVTSTEYVLHPDFNPDTFENDLGLIRLPTPVVYTSYIAPISLPLETFFNDSSNITIMGWGSSSDSDPDLSENLKFAQVSVLSTDECRLIYGDQITDNMACVEGYANERTCSGDTGGALVKDIGYYEEEQRLSPYISIIGVASFISSRGCESGDPSGYTRLSPYMGWLFNTIFINV